MTTKLIIHQKNVMVYYSYQGKVLRINSKILNSDNFNGEKFGYKEKDNREKNRRLTSLQTSIEDIINNYWIKHQENPPVQYIKDTLKEKPEEVVKYYYVYDYYKEFLNYKESTLITKPSMKDYYSLKNSLILYEHINRKKLSLSDINNVQFMRRFEGFLSKKHELTEEEKKKYKTRGGVNHNTLIKRISTLKSFLTWSVENKYISKNELENKKVSVNKYVPTIITFSTDELKSLKRLKNLTEKEEKIRDMMLFMCLTGVSFSDMIKLNELYIEKDNNTTGKNSFKLVKKRQKGRISFEVPLLHLTMEILKKYNFQMNHYSNQEFNIEIKTLLKNNNICDYDVKIEEQRGNEQQNRISKKYDKIASHNGRRTFISRCVIENLPISVIMSMTGHKKLDTFLHYINIFQEKNTNKLLQKTSI